MVTVAAKVVEALKEIGVQYVFGVPSGGWVDYMEALRKEDGMEFILATHDGAAGMMAAIMRVTSVLARFRARPEDVPALKVSQTLVPSSSRR